MSCRQGNCGVRLSEGIWSSPVVGPGRTPLREEEVVPDKSSFNVPALQRRTLRNQVMTRRRIETPDLFRMTVHTREDSILIDRLQLFVQILSAADFVVTLCTRRDRYVRLQFS